MRKIFLLPRSRQHATRNRPTRNRPTRNRATRNRPTRNRPTRNRQGALTVEFAFVVPVLLILFFGGIELTATEPENQRTGEPAITCGFSGSLVLRFLALEQLVDLNYLIAAGADRNHADARAGQLTQPRDVGLRLVKVGQRVG